jgi:hypothetical protein
MQVRIIVGANAYACVTDGPTAIDFRLEPGRGAPQSLRETAMRLRREAADRIARAECAERAASHLEEEVQS